MFPGSTWSKFSFPIPSVHILVNGTAVDSIFQELNIIIWFLTQNTFRDHECFE